MIPILNIEDLTLDEADALIEKGVVFDVTSRSTSETPLLSKYSSGSERNQYWSAGDKYSGDIQ